MQSGVVRALASAVTSTVLPHGITETMAELESPPSLGRPPPVSQHYPQTSKAPQQARAPLSVLSARAQRVHGPRRSSRPIRPWSLC